MELVLSLIVAYYLIKTGDLFKILAKVRKVISDLFNSSSNNTENYSSNPQPLEVLKLRLAKGEISQKEYEQIKNGLSI